MIRKIPFKVVQNQDNRIPRFFRALYFKNKTWGAQNFFKLLQQSDTRSPRFSFKLFQKPGTRDIQDYFELPTSKIKLEVLKIFSNYFKNQT